MQMVSCISSQLNCLPPTNPQGVMYQIVDPSRSGHYKTWTLDSGLDHGLDSRLNNGLDNWTRFLIIRGQRLLSGKVMLLVL